MAGRERKEKAEDLNHWEVTEAPVELRIFLSFSSLFYLPGFPNEQDSFWGYPSPGPGQGRIQPQCPGPCLYILAHMLNRLEQEIVCTGMYKRQVTKICFQGQKHRYLLNLRFSLTTDTGRWSLITQGPHKEDKNYTSWEGLSHGSLSHRF